MSRPPQSRVLVRGLASTRVIGAAPSVRAKDMAPPWPQLRGSFSVVSAKSANRDRSTGRSRSTSTRRVCTGPGPGAGVEPGATVNSPLPESGTVRRRIPAPLSAAVGASGSGVTGGGMVCGEAGGAGGAAEAEERDGRRDGEHSGTEPAARLGSDRHEDDRCTARGWSGSCPAARPGYCSVGSGLLTGSAVPWSG